MLCATPSAAAICIANRSASASGKRPPERLAFDVLHHQVIRTDVMERADVRMIQRGDGASFLLKTRRVLALELFNRDDTVQPRVTRLLNLAHAARTNRRKDFVRAEFVARLERHLCSS